MKYETLNDAAETFNDFKEGETEIWYCKGRFSRDAYSGTLPISPQNLGDTHVLLGKIAATIPGRIFTLLQGDNWSWNGQAYDLILGKGLDHTSMSIGDVIVIKGKALVVAPIGFKEL